jgi:hypothetical protein
MRGERTCPASKNVNCCVQANALVDSSDHSSRSSEAKFFGIEFSDLHGSKENSVKPRCDQLDAQLFEVNTSLMKTLFCAS